MPTILTTTIRFTEISLQTRDAHKLRGYFGEYFKEQSPLLHNHYEDGTARYKYPLVQYKVIDHVPMLLGLNDGAELLTSLFLKIHELELAGTTYPIYSKNISQQNVETGIIDELMAYKFVNHWMALNSDNYKEYLGLTAEEQQAKLNRVLRNNILSFFKGVGVWLEDKIMVKGNFTPRSSNFKDNKMMVFEGEFVSNVSIPDYAGIGKSVSRGFGVVKRN
ncbi:MAG: CRISPR-associated endonuclease Cas6 [Anditalea sp.]